MKITIAKCDRCGKTFHTYSGLYFCENNKQFCIALCEDCSKSFRQWLNHGPCSDCVHVPDEEYDPCEDCVSRQAVLDMATVIETDDYSRNEIMEVVDTDDIKALPSVTPVSKKSERAHWIDNYNGTISCGCCHAWFHKDDRYSYMRYCPNCGAEMRVEE